MTTKIIQHTPLNVTAHAVRTCWQSFGKSDNGGPADLELIDRVGNKFKHASTLEHSCWLFTTEDENLRKVFSENSFSDVTITDKEFVISTNIRAVQGLNLTTELLNEILPIDYKYLFEELGCIFVPNQVRKPLPKGPLLFSSDLGLIKSIDPEGFLQHLTYTFYPTEFSRALLQELSRHRTASPSVKSSRYTMSSDLKEEVPFVKEDKKVAGGIHSELGNYSKDTAARASGYLVITGNDDVDSAAIQALDNLRILVGKKIPNDKVKYALIESYKTEEVLTIKAPSLRNFLYLRSDKSALWEIRELADLLYKSLPKSHQPLFSACMRN